MRTHTSQFKDEIKQYGRQFTDKLYYNNNEYDGEHLFSVNYSVDTTLCKSIMQSLRIDTDISLNVGDTLDYGINLENTTDEIRFNNFIVNKIEEQKDKKSNLVTCYDNMIKTMKDYETPKVNGVAITYPITIRDYLIAICNHLGLTFKNASDTFTNYNKQVTSEHYVDTDGNSLGYTFRNTLDDIAEATGSFIVINENNELEVKDITNTTNRNLYTYDGAFYNSYINDTYLYYGTNYSSIFFPCKPNTTYTISKLRSSLNHIGTIRSNSPSEQRVYNVVNMSSNTTYDGTTRVNGTLTTGSNDKYIVVEIGRLSGDDYNGRNKLRNSIQIEYGTEVTEYENKQLDIINEEYFNDKNVNIGKKVGPYNVVVLSRQDVDNLYYPSTLPSNPIEFKISDNAILDQDNREDFIQGIYDKINGLEFYLNDFQTNGILYYEIGDKYNVSIDNVTYTCLMLNDNIKRTTGLKENIHTDEPKQSVTEFKYASSTDRLEKQSRNAIIKVDKANASIEQIVSAVGSNGQVTSASIIQSINNDTSQIKLEADKIDLNGAVTANNNFQILTDGSVQINGGNIDLVDEASGQPYHVQIYRYVEADNVSYETTLYASQFTLRKVDTTSGASYEQESIVTPSYFKYSQHAVNDTSSENVVMGGAYTPLVVGDLVNGSLVSGVELNGTNNAIKYLNNGNTLFNVDSSGNTTINGGLNYKGQFLTSGNADDYKEYTTCMSILNHNSSFLNVPTIEPNGDDVGFLNVYCWGGNTDWTFQEYVVLKWNKTYKYIRRKVVQGWNAWERIYKATTIFEGWADNTISNLPYNLTDFDFIEIVYTDEAGRIAGSLKFNPVDQQAICLTLTETESGFIVIKSGHWHSNGNSLVCDNSSFTQIFHNGSIVGNNNAGWLRVSRIIGYS